MGVSHQLLNSSFTYTTKQLDPTYSCMVKVRHWIHEVQIWV